MEIVSIAVVLFIVTNLDDVFLLMAFFADPALKTRHIVAGQYIGIAVLYAVSVVASLVGLLVPEVYIGLLGLVPIGIGTFKWWELWRGHSVAEASVRAAGGKVAAVAAITLASGGDNIAVYVPVFAIQSLGATLAMGSVFIVMVALWVSAAHWLFRHPRLGAPIRRYGHQAIPFVLIAIGVLVFWEARSYTLLW